MFVSKQQLVVCWFKTLFNQKSRCRQFNKLTKSLTNILASVSVVKQPIWMHGPMCWLPAFFQTRALGGVLPWASMRFTFLRGPMSPPKAALHVTWAKVMVELVDLFWRSYPLVLSNWCYIRERPKPNVAARIFLATLELGRNWEHVRRPTLAAHQLSSTFVFNLSWHLPVFSRWKPRPTVAQGTT